MTKRFLVLTSVLTTLFGFYYILEAMPASAETKGIWIEAENEASSFIYPVSQRPAVNMKETKPSWRPPYFGSGDWYLASGGEYLTYDFSVPQGGKYNVWVRDYVDKFQARGVRRFIMEFDGKGYGIFSEVNIPAEGPKGAFGWHKVGIGVELKAGAHKMKITKEATTAGAVILDAFYFTLSGETPEKKSVDEPIQETSEVFPVAELGNCISESNCKQYCAESKNMLACANYGEKRGLVSSDEAAKAREFADVLRGEGPGGCKDQKGCENYCNGTDHLSECVVFAEKHNLLPADQLKEAKQVLAALSAGGKLPGGCTDKNSCESYCGDPSHGGECVDFAEKAGFMTAEEVAEARKVLPLIARGESPGGCKNKEQCEKYCESEANTMECVTFAEKAGFMTSEEAAMVRKTGGKGPGGCRSKEACESYCNESQNQEACFEFATKYDLIPPEKLQEIKEGMGRLRSGLKQMPESAVSCLRSTLGEEAMARIEDGSFMPSPKMGEIMKGCVAQAMPEIKAKIESAMEHATPETRSCLERGLGVGGLDKVLAGGELTPEMGDVMRTCFESMRTEGMKQMREGLGQMPEEMRTCVKDKLGSEFIGKVERGEDVEIGPEIGEAFQSCAGNAEEIMDKALEQAPLGIRDCIKSKIGDVSKIRGPQDVMGYVQECMQGFMPKGILPGMIPGAGYRPPGVPGGGGSGGELYGDSYSGATYASDFSGTCDEGWNLISNPKTGRKYCAITQEQCSKDHSGTVLTQDQSGYNVCWLKVDSARASPVQAPVDIKDYVPQGIPVLSGEIKIPEGVELPESACTAFNMAPSCDYVPESVRDLCKKCKN